MCIYLSSYSNMFLSALGVGLGISSFISFLNLQNIQAGSWSLASAVFALVVFHLHYLNSRRTLDSWHDTDTLQGIQFLGLVVMTVGIAGTAWYIFYAVYYAIPWLPPKHSAYLTAIWAFMTAKWGMLILIFGKHFTNVIRRENPRLLAIS